MPDDQTAAERAAKLRELADLPAKAIGDNGMTEERSAGDIIKLNREAALLETQAARRSGFRLTKIVPGGPA